MKIIKINLWNQGNPKYIYVINIYIYRLSRRVFKCILVLEVLEKMTFNRNSVSMSYFEACFFFGCITLFSVYILLKYASVII